MLLLSIKKLEDFTFMKIGVLKYIILSFNFNTIMEERLKKNLEYLPKLIEEIDLNTEKFLSKNNAAGTRARAYLQEIIVAAREMRKDIQAIKTREAGK